MSAAAPQGRFAERLEILLGVGRDLLARTNEFRQELPDADLASELFLSERIAKRMREFDGTGVPAVKEKDQGYDVFFENAAATVTSWAPLFNLVLSIHEFRAASSALLAEMSECIVMLKPELNILAFRRYFDLFLTHAQLHLLLSVLLEKRGRMMLAAYCSAHVLSRQQNPAHSETVFRVAAEYATTASTIRRLQEDFAAARLRLDWLLPLGAQLRKLSDGGSLRREIESELSPLVEKQGGKNTVNASVSVRAGDVVGGADGDSDRTIDPVLGHLADVKQWFVFGLLLAPDSLGEPEAVDTLLTVLNTAFVVPVHGTDVLWPHAEFEAQLKAWDSKAQLRIFGKKDEAKRFKAGIADSRLAAFRTAAATHLALRTALCTKLSHLQNFLLDSPDLLFAKLPRLLCALRLAQAEVAWWALHHEAVPDGIPKKVLEEVASRDDPSSWAPVMSLVKYSMALKEIVAKEHGRLLQAASTLLADETRMTVEGLVNAAPHDQFAANGCEHLSALMRDFPAHLASTATVGCDLRGLRLNALRLVCDLSVAGAYSLTQQSPTLLQLLSELQAAAVLSEGVDDFEALIHAATDAPALLADVRKLKVLFDGGLDHQPAACVPMMQLAAAGCARPAVVVRQLQAMLDARLISLLRVVALHLNARRNATPPPDTQLTHHQAMHRLCVLCAALDKAPMLAVGGERFSLREWMRERLELAVEKVFGNLFFGRDGSLHLPTVALSQLHDWSQTLSSIRYFVSVDVHAILNAALAREVGLLDPPPEGEAVDADPAELPPVRAAGIDRSAASRAATSLPADRPKLLARIIEWYSQAVRLAASPGGEQYVPGRRAFGAGSALCSVQFAALCRLIGTAGMLKLHDMLLATAGQYAATVKAALVANQAELSQVQKAVGASCELPQLGPLQQLGELLAHCKALGVVLVTRQLLLQGMKQAKAELFPSSIASFVKGLGDQQLPDERRAADGLMPVATLLASFGLAGSQQAQLSTGASQQAAARDALLDAAIDARCGVSADPKLWQLLPCALALSFFYEGWDGQPSALNDDTVSANLHCLAHGLHAMLSVVEPHMPPGRSGARSAKLAHRTFLHVSSLVLGQLRIVALQPQLKPPDALAKERAHASMLLVIEQFVQLAGPLNYGDAESYVPHSLVAAAYAQELAYSGGMKYSHARHSSEDQLPQTATGDDAPRASLSRGRQASTASFRE